MSTNIPTISSIVDQITARAESLDPAKDTFELAQLAAALSALLDVVEREHRLTAAIRRIEDRIGRESA